MLVGMLEDMVVGLAFADGGDDDVCVRWLSSVKGFDILIILWYLVSKYLLTWGLLDHLPNILSTVYATLRAC